MNTFDQHQAKKRRLDRPNDNKTAGDPHHNRFTPDATIPGQGPVRPAKYWIAQSNHLWPPPDEFSSNSATPSCPPGGNMADENPSLFASDQKNWKYHEGDICQETQTCSPTAMEVSGVETSHTIADVTSVLDINFVCYGMVRL